MIEFWTTDPALEGGLDFEASRSLWPDPFEAPGVPPIDVLIRLAEHPEEDPDLVAQIQESVEGRRALFSALSLRGLMGTKQGSKPLAAIARRKYATCLGESPHFGEIRHTSPVVEVFDGHQLVPRRTWTPPMVLLVSEPQDMCFDVVCRAVYCTLVEVCDEELLEATPNFQFGDGSGFRYVAHLDLECPVSTAQLGALVGRLDGAEVVALQEVMAAHLAEQAHPRLCAPGMLSTQGRAAYLRMAANAEWAAATALARRAHDEAAQQAATEPLPLIDTQTRRLISQAEEHLPLAAAGGGQHFTPLLYLPEPTESLGEAVALAMRGEIPLRQATMADPPYAEADGTATGQWISEGRVSKGSEFFLVNKTTGHLLGAGHAAAEGVLRLEHGEQPSLENSSPAEFFLILVEEGA